MERDKLLKVVTAKYPSKKPPVVVPLEQELCKLMEEFPDIRRVRDVRIKGGEDEYET